MSMGWQPETQPKGKPPVEKTKGAETMQRLIDTQDAFNVLSDYYHHNSATQHLALQEALNKVPTVDAVPLDGSFLKMSRGDYLIYKRHWLYEHFDQEIDIQRSAMKSMGYEYVGKNTDAVRHGKWIDEGQPDDFFPHRAWRCSECGEQVLEIGEPWYKYCPNCGADMRGEKDG